MALGAGLAPAAQAATTFGIAGGGWSWFGDPRAVAIGNDVFLGWITSEGNVEVARMNMRTGGWAQARLHATLPSDDHSNPSLTVLPDQRLVAFYTPHSGRLTTGSRMWFRVGLRPRGVTAWGRERTVPVNSPGPFGYTYPNPVRVGGRLYLFWRGGNWQPTFSHTRDLRSWAPAQTLLQGPRGQRPYIKFDGYRDGIRFAYTGAHPGSRTTDLYFGELRAGAVRSAAGRRLVSRSRLPFDYRRGERVYRWQTAGRAWVWDISHDAAGHPVIVYATIQSRDKHTYRYARWDGKAWYDRALAEAGPHINGNPTYSAGATLDHSDPDIVYLSRLVNGRFELERWETFNGGRTWIRTPITESSSSDNLRPFVPRGMSGDRILLWSRGNYVAFRDFGDLAVTVRAELPDSEEIRWGGQRGEQDAERSPAQAASE